MRTSWIGMTQIALLAVLAGACVAPINGASAGEKEKPGDESEAILKGLKLPKGFVAEMFTAPKQVTQFQNIP